MDFYLRFCGLGIILSVLFMYSEEKQCPRDKSRTVANVVRERLMPVFHRHKVEVSSACPLDTERDVYAWQENKKIMESGSRWSCNYCGKSFLSEYFIDMHFDNRHTDKIQEDNSVCLADVCDVFRCDIVSGESFPDFWDIALCLEDDMLELMGQCEKLLDACIPAGLTQNKTETMKGELRENVCSFLTCIKYWNTPFEKTENTYLALSVVLVCLTTFGIIIYTFVFYNYFYTDFIDPLPYDPTLKHRHKMRPYPGQRPYE